MEIAELKKEMDARFEKVDGDFRVLRAEVKAEGETTRRHFNLFTQKLAEVTKLMAARINRY